MSEETKPIHKQFHNKVMSDKGSVFNKTGVFEEVGEMTTSPANAATLGTAVIGAGRKADMLSMTAPTTSNHVDSSLNPLAPAFTPASKQAYPFQSMDIREARPFHGLPTPLPGQIARQTAIIESGCKKFGHFLAQESMARLMVNYEKPKDCSNAQMHCLLHCKQILPTYVTQPCKITQSTTLLPSANLYTPEVTPTNVRVKNQGRDPVLCSMMEGA